MIILVHTSVHRPLKVSIKHAIVIHKYSTNFKRAHSILGVRRFV
jgi:hypothetical protein